MRNRLLININGKYFGRIVNTQVNPDNTITIITRKLNIHRAEPVKYVDEKTLIRIWKQMKEEADAMKAGLFLTIANVQYDSKKINQDDILPIITPDADAIIVLRNNNWDKIPLEAIGINPEDADQVAKWYTLYLAMKHTLLNYHHDLDRYRMELVRYAELNKRLMKAISERDNIIVDLQSKVSELNLQLYSLARSVDNMERLLEISAKETDTWRKAYVELKNKLHSLLNLVPTIIEYVNKLATAELEKEVEVGVLKQQISKLDTQIEETLSEMYNLKKELKRVKEEVKSKETTVEIKEEEKQEQPSKESEEEEASESEEGEEEFL